MTKTTKALLKRRIRQLFRISFSRALRKESGFGWQAFTRTPLFVVGAQHKMPVDGKFDCYELYSGISISIIPRLDIRDSRLYWFGKKFMIKTGYGN